MAQWLRAVVALLEDLGGTYLGDSQLFMTLVPGGSDNLF